MDLGPYLLRIALLLPLVCGIAVAALWAARRLPAMRATLAGPSGAGAVRLIGTASVAPGSRLVVVAFGGRHWLVASSRAGLNLIGDVADPSAAAAFAPLLEGGGD